MNPFKAHSLRSVFFSLIAIIFSLLQWQTAWALPKTKQEFFEQYEAAPSKFLDSFELYSNEEIITWLNTPLEGDEEYGEEKTPPFNLIHCCNEDVIFFFIKKGLDITITLDNGYPLLFAMIRKKYFKLVRYFLENGVALTIQSSDGKTALHHAINVGSIEMIELLLEYGASYSQVIADQEKLLYSAAAAGHTEVVGFLLNAGASPVYQYNGITPLHIAAHNGHSEITQLLIDHGVNPNAETVVVQTLQTHDEFAIAANHHGSTPLLWAASSGQLAVVQILLAYGTSVTAVDNHGNTPLLWAASNGHLEVVQILLEHGSSVTTANNDGNTSLHLAASNGHLEVVQTLLAHHASATAVNNNGYTPLNLASGNTAALLCNPPQPDFTPPSLEHLTCIAIWRLVGHIRRLQQETLLPRLQNAVLLSTLGFSRFKKEES